MTDAQLAEIEARLAAAAFIGELEAEGTHIVACGSHTVINFGAATSGTQDAFLARLFAHAPADLAALLAYVRTLQSILGDLAQDPDGEGYRRALEQGRRAGLAEAERIVREQEALYPDTIRAALAAPRALRQAADTIREAAGRPQP